MVTRGVQAVFWWTCEDDDLRGKIRSKALEDLHAEKLDETLVGFTDTEGAKEFMKYLKDVAAENDDVEVAGGAWAKQTEGKPITATVYEDRRDERYEPDV